MSVWWPARRISCILCIYYWGGLGRSCNAIHCPHEHSVDVCSPPTLPPQVASAISPLPNRTALHCTALQRTAGVHFAGRPHDRTSAAANVTSRWGAACLLSMCGSPIHHSWLLARVDTLDGVIQNIASHNNCLIEGRSIQPRLVGQHSTDSAEPAGRAEASTSNWFEATVRPGMLLGLMGRNRRGYKGHSRGATFR